MILVDPKSAALVMIDLQRGIMARQTFPRSTGEVLAGARTAAGRFRAVGMKIIWVTVAWEADYADALQAPVDEGAPRPPGHFPEGFADLGDGLAGPGDLHIRKRQWGAFYGTDLDLQLRRRGIDTVLLGGVATNFGVESTARDAWERGYKLIVLEDLCAGLNAEAHAFAFQSIFPRIARVRQSAEVAFAG